MSYFTASDNCKIYYEEHGTGEPLIFIHGWTCNATYFYRQIEYFSKSRRVIAYDARGHGRSDRGAITERNLHLPRFAADLHELIEALGIEKADLVGWSMGTCTLLAYVRAFGCQYVNKLCMIDMSPKIVHDDEWSLGLSTETEVLRLMSMAAEDWNIAAEDFLPSAFVKGTPRDTDAYRAALADMQSNTPHVMVFAYIAMATEDFRPVLQDITAPVLLAYAGDGLICTPAHGEYMKQHIKNSKLVIFNGCGHGLFMDDPDRFNAELEAFLAE
ncbi:MAG: alpha/beta hydrolase [Clostridiales Family XIII bacterium]|jgi:pimeloyl-ACP methyl ester carboxylesterase|nr:alpha/beta hydrolase [Clostridiales Family XIII bacterium]